MEWLRLEPEAVGQLPALFHATQASWTGHIYSLPGYALSSGKSKQKMEQEPVDLPIILDFSHSLRVSQAGSISLLWLMIQRFLTRTFDQAMYVLAHQNLYIIYKNYNTLVKSNNCL